MPALGLSVPKKSIDEIFDEWDKGDDGSLEFAELKRILSAKSPPAKEVKIAGSAAMAAVKMGGMARKLGGK